MATVVSSSYNSLQISVKHNEKYADFLIAYTYEKSIDNGSTSFDATNPFDPRASRALSVFDVPQDLTVSYTVQLPFDKLTGDHAKKAHCRLGAVGYLDVREGRTRPTE